MTFPDILTACMVLFMFVGVLDHIFGNRFGLGEQFLEGFRAFGSLAVTMTGVLVLLPYLEAFLGPVLTPVCTALGIDPAMLAGIFLACDMGGLPLAQSLAASPEGAGLGGMILGSMMGANIVFNIPVALGIGACSAFPFFVQLRKVDSPAAFFVFIHAVQSQAP